MSEETQALGAADWRLPGFAAVRDELARDRALFAAIGVYVLAAGGLAAALGRPGEFVAFAYVRAWASGVLALGALAVVLVELPRSIRAAPTSPLTHLIAAVRARINPRLLAGLALLTAMSLFYGAFTSIKSMLPHIRPFEFDVWAADMDARLHGGHDPWRLLQPLLGRHAVTRAIQHIYLPGWTVVLFASTAAIAVSRRLAPLRPQFFWTYLLAWPLVGNLLAGAVMTAGPAYYGRVTGDGARFGDLLSYTSFSHGMADSSFDLQEALWSVYASGDAGLGSGISAFPSMHVAMATLYVLAARRIHPWLAMAAGAFAVAIMAGSVHLGWHYAIDGYASAAVTVALWSVVGLALRSREARAQAVGNPLSRR